MELRIYHHSRNEKNSIYPHVRHRTDFVPGPGLYTGRYYVRKIPSARCGRDLPLDRRGALLRRHQRQHPHCQVRVPHRPRGRHPFRREDGPRVQPEELRRLFAQPRREAPAHLCRLRTHLPPLVQGYLLHLRDTPQPAQAALRGGQATGGRLLAQRPHGGLRARQQHLYQETRLRHRGGRDPRRQAQPDYQRCARLGL